MDEQATSGPAIGAVIPAPVWAQVGPVDVRLDAGTAVLAGPGAEDVGSYLAEMLRELTGFAVPVLASGAGEVLVSGEPVSGAATIALWLDPERRDDGPEGYELAVGADGIVVRAAAPAGLFHGVQTLNQLLPVRPEWTVPGGRIVDRPRLEYRGLMLDVARHFFPVGQVQRVIDLAARYKLNHLHLHLTDDQGWRIAIDAWPRLAGYGGGTEVGDGPGGFYSKDDYRAIVAYARSRFVTVVPEIDLPGHTNAALASYPELNEDGVAPDRYTGIDVGFSSLAVDRELTYTFLDAVFGELAELTPGPYLHIGGDEAKTLGPEDYARIVERAQRIVRAHGKMVVGWHEIAAARLEPSTVVQFWGTTMDSPDVVAAGNRIIMSPANRAYLDMKYDEASPLGLSWAGYVSLRDAYDWDPAHYVPGVDPARVIGIECPLWTETATALADLVYLALPRLPAIAELGWSTVDSHDWGSFRARLAAQGPAWTRLGLPFYAAPEVDWLR